MEMEGKTLAVVKTYHNIDDYINERPSEEEGFRTIRSALTAVRNKFKEIKPKREKIGFKVFDRYGNIRHKAPYFYHPKNDYYLNNDYYKKKLSKE